MKDTFFDYEYASDYAYACRCNKLKGYKKPVSEARQIKRDTRRENDSASKERTLNRRLALV